MGAAGRAEPRRPRAPGSAGTAPGSITDVGGVLVGAHTHPSGETGCTVVLCPGGAVPGVALAGTPLGTHEIDLVRSGQLVKRVDAVLLTGGSAFGLQAVQGVMRRLAERGQGFSVRGRVVPIVAAASIPDMAPSHAWPDELAGYRACSEAGPGPVPEGGRGVGAGARIGKAFGPAQAAKGGAATVSAAAGGDAVGVLAVIDCGGCVVDPATGRPVAGPRDPATGAVVCEAERLVRDPSGPQPWAGTSIAVVATGAPLSRQQANEVARAASHGLSRVIHPGPPLFDSWVVFVLSTAPEGAGELPPAPLALLGSLAARLVSAAAVRAAAGAPAP